MKIVAKTDKGLVRENNQDAYAVGELPGEVAWAVVKKIQQRIGICPFHNDISYIRI